VPVSAREGTEMNITADDILIGLDARPDMRHIDVTFTNPSIDTASVPETVSPLGGVLTFRSAAAVLEVVSSSDEDAAAGTGATAVRVWGLDENYVELIEDIVLTGTTPALGSALFFRINDVRVLTAGSTKSNVGNITVRDASAGTARSYITAAQGRSEVGLFTVPAYHTVIATGWTTCARDNVGNKALADFAFYSTADGVRVVDWRMIIDGTVPAQLGSPHVFHPKTDIEVICNRVNTNGSYVSFHGHGILVGPHSGI
jgi:hypothetical protein